MTTTIDKYVKLTRRNLKETKTIDQTKSIFENSNPEHECCFIEEFERIIKAN